MIGSRRNDDWAVSRAADCTLLVLEIDAEFDEGCQQSRRLHPDDNEDGDEGGGDKGPKLSIATLSSGMPTFTCCIGSLALPGPGFLRQCTHVTLSTPPGNIVGHSWPVHVTLYVC